MSMSHSHSSGQMTINLPGVIKTLGESLYSDPSVAIRELIQNANDACILHEAKYPDEPHEIHIHFNRWHSNLIIEDNGAGMTENEVKEFLTVIGNSKTDQIRTNLENMGQGDLAERLIGRFGLGLLASFIIGSSVEFVTLSYEEGASPIWWRCDGGQEYRMGTAKGKTTRGTTVTLKVEERHIELLRDDDKLSELIRLYADLLSIPIYLNNQPTPVNAMNAPWHLGAAEVQYRDFVVKRYPEEAILDIIPVDINEDDGRFKVGGVLFIPKRPLTKIAEQFGDVTVYVRRMFVRKNERDVLPEWARFVKGIIESPNLRETASRETIQNDENLQRVRKSLGQLILDHLISISRERVKTFKEIVASHNSVIKMWAYVSDEMFECIKDIVLFSTMGTDNELMNLPTYFEKSRFSRMAAGQLEAKRYIFYSITHGGTNSMLFLHRGLRVINAFHVVDEIFLIKYANKSEDIELRRLDTSTDFIFEQLSVREQKWIELEEAYKDRRVEAKVVRFEPADIPAVMISSESEPDSSDVKDLLADPTLNPALKNAINKIWDDRERLKRRLNDSGILYINADSQVIQQLASLNLHDQEILEVMTMIYTNAMMLSTQGTGIHLSQESARNYFKSNNKIIKLLMEKIYKSRELMEKNYESRELNEELKKELIQLKNTATVNDTPSAPSIEQTKHITCLLALPFKKEEHSKEKEYNDLIEALRDVLEVEPYFWEVKLADEKFFANTVSDNVGAWIARAQCFAVDISEKNENVMMELGHMYWGYKERPLILLTREGLKHHMADLGGRLSISYPWADPPDRGSIVAKLRREIQRFDELRDLRGEAHYLSTRLLKQAGPLSNEVVEKLAESYKTVEEFINEDPTAIASAIRSRITTRVQVGRGMILDIQNELRRTVGCDEKQPL